MKNNSFSYGIGFCTGESHHRYSIGYQDSSCSIRGENLLVSVVCDGCSTTPQGFSRNHVGAVLGAEIIATQAFRILNSVRFSRPLRSRSLKSSVDRISKGSFRVLKQVIDKIAGPESAEYRSGLVEDKFLFTVTGMVLLHETYFFFGIGDGCFGVNDRGFHVDPRPDRKYFLSSLEKGINPSLGVFASGIIKEGDIFWAASDGLQDLITDREKNSVFLNFLRDPDVTRWNSGKDQTIKAFRRMTNALPRKFSDDATIVVGKTVGRNKGNEPRP